MQNFSSENLKLHGQTALVTGGRINLGYHTGLRLLPCGAKVIVSTRYPRDSEIRYLAEKDSHEWTDSLKIVGADFRAASDVFYLVGVVKDILKSWALDSILKLDILINNTAQTLTDSLEKERTAVQREQRLLLNEPKSDGRFLHSGSMYQTRIRGGVPASNPLRPEQNYRLTGTIPGSTSEGHNNTAKVTPTKNTLLEITSQPKASSWMQSLDEIPYEDIISAHSINTFVPLILIRELLLVIGSPRSRTNPSSVIK
ncbi:hypothetical protein G7Y89_g5479 [Cudoniella acicularis]|uniref:Uncharacterized protein n=1 Tax=Cudoniella acicularis TaxID=354080 RepID=A0A8H4W5P4_9HELO|nr:hypothetical protein G7Y89_g5479 [Cudoniella acicularis]